MVDHSLTLDLCYTERAPQPSAPYPAHAPPSPYRPLHAASSLSPTVPPHSVASPTHHPVVSSNSILGDQVELDSSSRQRFPEQAFSPLLQLPYSPLGKESYLSMKCSPLVTAPCSASDQEIQGTAHDRVSPRLGPSPAQQVRDEKEVSKRDHRKLAQYGLQIMNELMERERGTSHEVPEGGMGGKDKALESSGRKEALDSKRFVLRGSARSFAPDIRPVDGLLLLDGMENLSYVGDDSTGQAIIVCNLRRVVECRALVEQDSDSSFPFLIVHRRVKAEGLKQKHDVEEAGLTVARENAEEETEMVEVIFAAPSGAEREAWVQHVSPYNPLKRLKGEMLESFLNSCRKMVSGNRRRYKDHCYDLDLTYITSRIIAMAFPGTDRIGQFSSMIRNDMRIVRQFFDEKHPGRYKVYNLCIEKTYSPKKFDGRMEWFPCGDHQPPSLRQIMRFCYSVHKWLLMHPDNVVAVHCKGGKGRTGLMVSCYLIFCGIFSSPAEAMRCFEEKRTRNPAGPAQGVTGASQKRYVSLFQQALTSRVDHRVLRIRQIIVHTIPRIEGSSQFDPLMVVRAAGGAAYELSHTPRQTSCFSVRSKMTFQCGGYGSMKLQPFSCSEDVFVQEDFRIELYNGVCKSSSAEQAVFFLCLHTGMMTGESPVVFAREELDVGVWFKKQVKLLDDNVSVEVHFEEVSAQHFAAALPWQKEAGESLDKSRSRSFREWLMRKSDHESGGNRNPGDTKKENTSLQKSFVSRMIASSEAISLSDQNIPRRCIVFNEDVELAFCARCVQELNPLLVKAGDVAVQQGAFSNSLFLIWVGNFRCEVVGQGGRAVVEHVIGSNEVFGELNFLLPNVSVQADYIANQDSTVFVLDKESLRESQYTGISEQCVNHFLACVCSCKLWSRLHSTSTTSASSSARRDSALSTKSSNSFFSRDLENNSFPFSRESSELQADPALLLQSLRELPVQELVLFTWNCTCEGKLRVSGLLKVTQSYLVYEAKGFLGKSRRVRFDMLEACGSEQEGSSKVLKLLLRHLPQAEHKSHHLILRFDSTRERTECERTVKRLKTLFDEPLGRAGAGPCAQLGAFHSLPELLEGSSSFRTVRVFKQGEHVAVKKSRSSERLGWVLHGSAVETVHGKVVRRAEVGDVLFLIDFFQHFKAYQSNVTASTDCKRLAVALVSFEDIRTMLDRNPSFASRFYEYSARTMALDLYRQGSQPQSLPDVPW